MAHKALIGGAAYEITGGKTLIDGTAYSIKSGKTLVGGTVYEVGFVKIITFEVYNSASFQSTTYQAEEGMTWAEWCGSEYDTNGAHIDRGGKVYPDNNIHGYLTGVISSDVIIEGMAYTIAIGGGSND